MNIFNKNYDKKKFVKRLDRLKKRAVVAKTTHKVTIIRIMSICMVSVLVAGGGIMGISAMVPKAVDNQICASVELDDSKKQGSADINEAGFVVDAKAAVLMDVGSGTVLFSQNGAAHLPPASVTKVMTMLLALEAVDGGQIALTDKVTVSERAASMGGSQMYMEPGEQHTLEELMKGISMVSANDACVAVAEYLAGSVEIFVENMNARAKELGMENTHFVNTNGLPVAEHYTSANDIAIMSCELIKHKKTHDWFTNWQDKIMVGLEGKQTEFGLTNTNRLIKQYRGANGIKTGFTQEAGYCLSGSASRDDMTLIAVVLGCPSSKVRFAEASKLLDYGFATYDTVKLAEKGEPNGLVEIQKGEPNYINAVAGVDIAILVKKGEKESITFKAEQLENIKAPIVKGEKLGDIVVYKNEKEIGRYPLVAEENADKATIMQLYKRLIKNLAK